MDTGFLASLDPIGWAGLVGIIIGAVIVILERRREKPGADMGES